MALLAPADGLSMDDLFRMPAGDILVRYGPQVYAMVGNLQASGAVPWRRSDRDLAITQQVRLEIMATEGDCRCGKMDCWREEMGLEHRTTVPTTVPTTEQGGPGAAARAAVRRRGGRPRVLGGPRRGKPRGRRRNP